MEKLCLIIDDENQERFFESQIQRVLKEGGCDVTPLYLIAKDPELLDENQDIDIEKLKTRIKEQIEGKSIDVIATDFNLSDENVNGLNVIEIIRELRRKTPIVLYSGGRENVIKSIIGRPDPNDSKKFILKEANPLIENVRKLMLHNISDFVERTGYDQAVIKILRGKELSTRQILLNKLREYPEMKFLSCYPAFTGKTLGEIAEEIEESTHQGEEFQSELIEQTVAYLIDISEEKA